MAAFVLGSSMKLWLEHCGACCGASRRAILPCQAGDPARHLATVRISFFNDIRLPSLESTQCNSFINHRLASSDGCITSDVRPFRSARPNACTRGPRPVLGEPNTYKSSPLRRPKQLPPLDPTQDIPDVCNEPVQTRRRTSCPKRCGRTTGQVSSRPCLHREDWRRCGGS